MSKGWKRINAEELETTIEGVRLRLVNLTREIGRRHWNLGVVVDDKVEWVESGSTRAEAEAWVERTVQAELERRRDLAYFETA